MNSVQTQKIKVLVPFMLAFEGGVRRLLQEALPALTHQTSIDVEYAELSGNQADMDRMAYAGVIVIRDLGVAGPGVLSFRSGFRRKIDLLGAVPRLLSLVLKLSKAAKRYDIVYAHSVRDLVLVASALKLLLPRQRPKLIWHCHGLGNANLKVVGVVARKCARVIAISDSVAEKLKAIGLPGTSVTRVYNATSASRDKTGGVAKSVPDLDEKAGNFIILLPSASIREDKGLLVAVDTVGNLPERVVLWITGAIDDLAAQPFLSGLHRRIDELGIADRVKFIGRREDIFEMMQRADLILVPSLCEEGFGLVAAEAMLLERPVMVSNRGGLPEVVGHESGLTFDPENVPVLVEKIRKVMDDPAMLDAISLAGRRRAEELFVYSQWSGKIAASMMQVCGRNINAENS